MLSRKSSIQYDVTIFQTPRQKDHKGYKAIYRTLIPASSRENCLEETFKRFNVSDLIPPSYRGRFLSTGDILLIDEGRGGQYYYQLKPGGWVPINRINLF